MGYFVYELNADKICLDRLPWFWNMAEKIFFFDEIFQSEETKLSEMLVKSRLRRVICDTFLSELMT